MRGNMLIDILHTRLDSLFVWINANRFLSLYILYTFEYESKDGILEVIAVCLIVFGTTDYVKQSEITTVCSYINAVVNFFFLESNTITI